jgi:hypothetical protein
MRYCNHCKKFTVGNPPYCNFCGRSYRVKLCPRGHKNPRAAQACSECGSKDLSTPMPQQAGMTRIGMAIGVGILGLLCAYAVYFAWQIFVNSGALFYAMRLGVELATLFLFWMLIFGKPKAKGK